MKNDFKSESEKWRPIINLWFKRIYVGAFNIYAWYWLYREIFVIKSNDFENYLLWAFMTFGMYFFVLDNDDVFIKGEETKK